ncbi:hypothetical protein HYFRA_00000572 [Hymenoscyphus fraxineus]|uniref:Heterokaryon incompatibility domain-containing protein n=1 Tax=Hymenoscyphus fraxineus TaxID=746836 RepID=A0A9N9L4X2_9HELO|nr:hypothetical protein HYFRA_00000572 [Hymenoscyphus fraxineus]
MAFETLSESVVARKWRSLYWDFQYLLQRRDTSLCRCCFKAFKKFIISGASKATIHENLASFRKSAASGCSLCSFVDKSCGVVTGDLWMVAWREDQKQMNLTLDLFKYYPNSDVSLLSLHIRRTEELGELSNQVRSYLSKGVLPLSVPSDKSFAIATYNHCLQDHKGCRIKSASWYPTRLIEVSWHNGVPSLRLVITKEDHHSGYLALSHCWGGPQPITLTHGNLHDMQMDIPLSALPKTFQDVVQVLGWLKVSYIWIDSLCILQDSKEDWQRECATMDKVYSNSLCTISASRAASASEGCFGDHTPVSRSPIKIPVWVDRWVLTKKALDIYRDLLLEPLAQRAWAFQENALSFRNLHFSTQGLVWECQEMITSQEVFERAENSAFVNFHSIKMDSSRNVQHIFNISSKQSTYKILQNWSQVLKTFSKCKITKEDDRLPAISGVAKKFEEILEDKYLAGLWLSRLHAELLWQTISGTGERSPRRNPSYVAPSWSWASLNAGISPFPYWMRGEKYVYFAEILQANVEPVSDDHTGQLKGGFIRLIGVLQHVRVFETPTAPRRSSLLEFCNLVERNLQSESVSRKGTRQDIIYGQIDVDDMVGVNEQFLFLPLLSNDSRYHEICHGILLRETADAGIFTRVGTASIGETPHIRYNYTSDYPNWQQNMENMRIDYYARKKEVYKKQDYTTKGPHNLFLGDPEVPPEGLVRLVPQEITII